MHERPIRSPNARSAIRHKVELVGLNHAQLSRLALLPSCWPAVRARLIRWPWATPRPIALCALVIRELIRHLRPLPRPPKLCLQRGIRYSKVRVAVRNLRHLLRGDRPFQKISRRAGRCGSRCGPRPCRRRWRPPVFNTGSTPFNLIWADSTTSL